MESYRTDPTYMYAVISENLPSTYYTHFKHKVPHEIYDWIRDGIGRHISAIFVSAVLYFTWCGAVHTFSHTLLVATVCIEVVC